MTNQGMARKVAVASLVAVVALLLGCLPALASSSPDAAPAKKKPKKKKKKGSSCNRPLPAGDQTVQLTVDGRSRPFVLYVPNGYNGRKSLPVLLNLHGSGGTGPGQMDVSGLRATADAGGFLVAAPSGGAIAGAGFAWVVPGVPPNGTEPPGGFPDDVKYLLAVVSKIQAIACQDRAKVFSTGYSGGARMTSALACDAADRITAIVADAGLRAGAPAAGGATPDPSTCAPARPLPIFALHGTADGTNPYDGGGAAYWQYSVPEALAAWGRLNGCTPSLVVRPVVSQVDELGYDGCASYATVRLYRITGGAHDWFSDPTQIRTNDVIRDVIARFSFLKPKLGVKGLPGGCADGSLKLRLSVTDDSPTQTLVATLDGKRVLRRLNQSAVKFKLGSKPGPHVLRLTATDRAGLVGTRKLSFRGCG